MSMSREIDSEREKWRVNVKRHQHKEQWDKTMVGKMGFWIISQSYVLEDKDRKANHGFLENLSI